ncbi:MAG: alpha/beta fold hydrolase [Pseudomonadota bacterium]
MRVLIVFSLIALLAACTDDRGVSPIVPEAAQIGTVRDVYVVTNRAPHDTHIFGIERAFSSSYLRLGVSIPPQRTPGTVRNGHSKPNPRADFTLVSRTDHPDRAQFRADLARGVQASQRKAATLFVHGYNNTFVDPVFRLAQLAHDLQLPSALVALSWPSRAQPLGYQYDTDSTYFSRDMMQDTLFDIAATNPSEFVLVGHSMGSVVVMETLRQIELAQPGWAARNLDGVILMSPDLDVDVFRQVMRSFKEVPQPFIIMVSGRDQALRLSAWIRGDEVRVGNLTDLEPLANLPVQIIDLSNFESFSTGNHLTAAASPAVLSILNAAREFNRDFAGGAQREFDALPGQRRILRNASKIILLPPR